MVMTKVLQYIFFHFQNKHVFDPQWSKIKIQQFCSVLQQISRWDMFNLHIYQINVLQNNYFPFHTICRQCLNYTTEKYIKKTKQPFDLAFKIIVMLFNNCHKKIQLFLLITTWWEITILRRRVQTSIKCVACCKSGYLLFKNIWS